MKKSNNNYKIKYYNYNKKNYYFNICDKILEN